MKKFFASPKNIFLTAFVALEAVIYIVYNIIVGIKLYDTALTVTIKFIGILLCFAVAVFFLYSCRNKDSVIVVIALLFTVISDLFILVLDDLFYAKSLYPLQYEIGLMTFLVTHFAYYYRLYADRLKKIWISLTVRLTLIAVSVGVMCGIFGFDFLLVEACVYIIILTANVVEAFIICRRSRKNLIFALGLLLFLLCDIFVGLQNSAMIGLDLRRYMDLISYSIWIFYLPGQVLLALSVSPDGVSGKIEKQPETVAVDGFEKHLQSEEEADLK